METFVIFLIAGLVAFGALLVLFGGITEIEPIGIGTEAKVVYNISGAVLVGPEDVDAHKQYDMNLDVSYKKGEEIYPLEGKELSNGLLFGSDSIKYHIEAEGIDSLDVNFRIVRTNSYAPLVIKINNKIAHEKVYYPGYSSISIDEEFLSEDMLIEIEAASSGWKIWAPNVYLIEDVELKVKSYLMNSNEFKFTLLEEYNNFKQGKIDLHLDENMGKLVAKLNNRIIYSDVVSDYKTIEFNKSALRSGKNSLVIKADLDSFFSGKADLTIFYKTEEMNRIEKTMNITESEYSAFDDGRIEFSIVDLITPGGVSVKIMYFDETLYSEYKTASTGDYEVSFGKDDIREGVNTVIIESIDDAVFLVKGFKVSY